MDIKRKIEMEIDLRKRCIENIKASKEEESMKRNVISDFEREIDLLNELLEG